MALHTLPLSLVTLHLVCKADARQRCAVADGSLVQQGGTLAFPLTVHQAVMTASHQHVPLLRAADWSGGLGDVWEVRQSRHVVQQAGRLRVGGIAVAVFLLNVPP